MSFEIHRIEEKLLPSNWVDGWKKFESLGGDGIHQNFGWKVYRSDIALCLFVCVASREVDSSKEFVRDQGLDLSDWNSYLGYSHPVFCLIQCSEETVAKWRLVSGYQEWLRGQISFQIVLNQEEARTRLELLLSDSFSVIEKIQPLKDDALAKKLEEAAKGEEKLSKQHRLLLTQMSKGFETSNVHIVLDQWEKELMQDYQDILEGDDA